MYSYEERMNAVKLLIKYDLSYADTVRELGYPDRRMLRRWYEEYRDSGEVHRRFIKHPNFDSSKIRSAVDYYLEHGRSIARTCKAMGYPSRGTLRNWIEKYAPEQKKTGNSGGIAVQYSQEQKKDAVIDLCARVGSAEAVAKMHGTSRVVLYKWRNELLGVEGDDTMKRFAKSSLPNDKEALEEILSDLKEQVYRQQMELDILNKAAEIIKKGQGVDPRKLANKEKTSLIDALRMKYPLNELLRWLKCRKAAISIRKKPENSPTSILLYG